VVVCLFAGLHITDPSALPLAAVFMALIAILFTALGTAIASVMTDFQGFQLVMNFLVMPIFFLSGALFPLTNLPKVLDVLARIDPLSYGVDGLRTSLTGIVHFGFVTDLAVLSIVTASLLVVGSYLFSKIQL
jgi:ABC-2 type transport system permease protein